jgi:hypothetical protein
LGTLLSVQETESPHGGSTSPCGLFHFVDVSTVYHHRILNQNSRHRTIQWALKTIGLAVLACAIGLVQAHDRANADTFYENFLGADTDGEYFDAWEGYYAEFSFDMTTPGDQASLYDANGDPVSGSVSVPPTADETGYTSGAHQIDAASLDFTFSSADWPK